MNGNESFKFSGTGCSIYKKITGKKIREAGKPEIKARI